MAWAAAVITGLVTLVLSGDGGGSRAKPFLVVGERESAARWSNPLNRTLYRLAVCETGGINGGEPKWTHRTTSYAGGLGFTHRTWSYYRRRVRPLPPAEADAAPAGAQYAVGRRLVYLFGFEPWPACSRRLGLQ